VPGRVHASTINALAYSPDGRYLASGSNDRLIKVWDTATGAELHSLAGHRGDVTGVAYSADGRSLVSCGHDGAIQLWHMATGRPLYQLDQLPQKALGLLWSPDRSHLMVTLEEEHWELLLYDTRQTPLKDADASGPPPVTLPFIAPGPANGPLTASGPFEFTSRFMVGTIRPNHRTIRPIQSCCQVRFHLDRIEVNPFPSVPWRISRCGGPSAASFSLCSH